jgi:signal transduction histidine kinase
LKLWRSSIRLRLSTLYVAGLGALLLVFGAGVFLLVRARLQHEIAAQSEAALLRLERYVQQEGLSSPEELEEPGYGPFLLLGSDGGLVYASSAWKNLGLPEDSSARTGTDRHAPHGEALQLDSLRFASAGRELQAFVALDRSESERSLSILLAVLLGGTILALLGALFLGYWLAGRALAPVAALARAAERVGVDDSSARLPVGAAHDEFDRLALEFNAVLERRQSAIGELRRFSSNVSHELRTPLTAMRLVGEQALRRGVDARGEEAIASMLEEVDRLTHLIEQLLCLARAEGAEADQRSTPIDLPAVAREVLSACAVLAEERGQELSSEFDDDVQAVAHPLLLRQALYNILDNAIRYTPRGGHLRVRARRLSREESALEVVDDGPGIAPADQARIFERFERLDRQSAAAGAGLGLAIARRAVETCRGRIELASALGVGSCFRIVLTNSVVSAPRVEARRAAQNNAIQESNQP